MTSTRAINAVRMIDQSFRKEKIQAANKFVVLVNWIQIADAIRAITSIVADMYKCLRIQFTIPLYHFLNVVIVIIKNKKPKLLQRIYRF